MRTYDEVRLNIHIVKNAHVGDLLDAGVLGQYEQEGGKDPTITCMNEPAVLAHEFGHFMETLFGLPASLCLPEKLEDCVRGVWREHSKSERGHSA